MSKHPMSDYYRSVVTDAAQIPDAALRALFLELLDRLSIQVVQEATPDYCVFKLTSKIEDDE